MKTYRNKQEGFKEIQKGALKITLPLLMLAIAVGFGISFYNTDSSDFSTLPFILLIGSVTVGFGMYKGIKRQRHLFNSYTLTVGEDLVQREQFNTPTITIRKAEIKEIVRYPNGSLLIQGNNPTDTIVMSAHVQDYDELVATLQEWREFRIHEASTQQKWLVPVIVGGLVLMATVYISTNKYLVLVSGTVLVAGLVWSVYQVKVSKNVDRKTKRSTWWSIVVILSVLGIMYAKLVA